MPKFIFVDVRLCINSRIETLPAEAIRGSGKALLLPLKVLFLPPKALFLPPKALLLPPKALFLPPKALLLPPKILELLSYSLGRHHLQCCFGKSITVTLSIVERPL